MNTVTVRTRSIAVECAELRRAGATARSAHTAARIRHPSSVVDVATEEPGRAGACRRRCGEGSPTCGRCRRARPRRRADRGVRTARAASSRARARRASNIVPTLPGRIEAAPEKGDRPHTVPAMAALEDVVLEPLSAASSTSYTVRGARPSRAARRRRGRSGPRSRSRRAAGRGATSAPRSTCVELGRACPGAPASRRGSRARDGSRATR